MSFGSGANTDNRLVNTHHRNKFDPFINIVHWAFFVAGKTRKAAPLSELESGRPFFTSLTTDLFSFSSFAFNSILCLHHPLRWSSGQSVKETFVRPPSVRRHFNFSAMSSHSNGAKHGAHSKEQSRALYSTSLLHPSIPTLSNTLL